MTRWVLLARLVRPQGRKGEIIADIFTDFPDRFAVQPRVFLGRGLTDGDATSQPAMPPIAYLIERHWLHQGRIVFKFKGVDSINDADTLRGLEVVVPSEERVPLEEDAVYIGDLVGCRILDLALPLEAAEVGEILDVERGLGGAPDILVVRPVIRTAAEKRTTGESNPIGSARPRRGKRPKKLPELLIPFAKKYVVSIDIANKQLEMRLPAGLTDLNAGNENAEPEIGEA